MGADAYLILAGDDAAALRALSAKVARRLAGAGWRKRIARPFVEVFAPSTSRLEIVEGLDGHGVLVGEVFDQTGRPLSPAERVTLAGSVLDAARAGEITTEVWGRYVLMRRMSGGAAVLRDPSGALEAVAWRKGGVTVVAPSAPSVLDVLLPDTLAIDWDALRVSIGRGGSFRHELGLTGLAPVAAGALIHLGPGRAQVRQLWRPGDIYRRGWDQTPPDLRQTIDQAVRALAGDRAWVSEVSGGLDSAIVAGALGTQQRSRVAAWVNHFVDDPEGDERRFARLVAERHGFALTEVRRRGVTLSAARLDRTADGFRPAVNDLDTDYNDDMDARIEATGAHGSITGQGGDAALFQMPSFLVAMDELHERGWRARPAVLHRIASWTGQSLWPAAWLKAWRAHARRRASWEHPWFDDLEGVPPAKALQIAALVNCQTFHGLAIRNRRGPTVHPLLSQPVMEAGLAWSTVDLTWGGRDRAAARAAYRDVLPAEVFARRSKGELGAFYGQAVAANLAFLRGYLLGGALAQAGLVGPDLEPEMTREALVWRGGSTRLLSLALTEAWLRRWQARIAARRG